MVEPPSMNKPWPASGNGLAGPPEGATRNLDVRHYVRVVWSHKWIVVATTVVAVAVALLFTKSQDKLFRAKATVIIETGVDGLFEESAGGNIDEDRLISGEILVIEGEAVEQVVVAELGEDADEVVAESVRGVDAIDVSVEDKDPERAADIANAYVDAYITLAREREVSVLNAQSAELDEAIAVLATQISDVSAALDAAVAADNAAADAAAAAAEAAGDTFRDDGPSQEVIRLTDERTSLVGQQDALEIRRGELLVDTALQTGGASLLSAATVPEVSVGPKAARNALLALFGGLAVGVALAFVREYLDDSLKTRSAVQSSTRLALLAAVPEVTGKRRKGAQLVSVTQPSSVAAESYRGLRTAVQHLNAERSVHVLQLASPSARQGTTTVVANLAVALARSGQDVLVIDANLRTPRLHEFFGLGNDAGLATLLHGKAEPAEVIRSVPGHDRLRVVCAGPVARGDQDLLSSPSACSFLPDLVGTGDVVLIDSPPALPFADAAVISGWVQGVMLVVAAGTTDNHDLDRAIESFSAVDTAVVGLIFNRAARHDVYSQRSKRSKSSKGSKGSPPASSSKATGKVAAGTARG